MNCFICTEKKPLTVSCAKCNGTSCKSCFQEYLLNSTLTPLCMHCREPLSDDFIIDNTSVGWRSSKYKIYKEQLLYDTERARFPETQVYAEAFTNAKAIMGPVVEELDTLKPILKASRDLIMAIDYFRILGEATRPHMIAVLEKAVPDFRNMQTKGFEQLRRTHAATRSTSKKRLVELNAISNLYSPVVATYGKAIDRTEKVAAVRRVLVKACPATGCNAFLNEEFCCGICKTEVCKKCHEIITIEDHVCNEETVASIKAVNAEARPCPACATLISKIDGCDQMWCTQCKTSFSWRTGLVETGITHNPHYYEWMRRNGGMPRAPGDNPGMPGCNDFPLVNQLLTAKPETLEKCKYSRLNAKALGNSLIDDADQLNYLLLTNYHAQFQHIHAHNRAPIQRPDHFELRVKLLVKEIDDATFKTKLQREDKAYKKCLAKKHVYDMTYAAAGDILRNCIAAVSFAETLQQLENLIKYSNSALERIEKGYSCVATKYLFYLPTDENRKHSYWYDIRYYNH